MAKYDISLVQRHIEESKLKLKKLTRNTSKASLSGSPVSSSHIKPANSNASKSFIEVAQSIDSIMANMSKMKKEKNDLIRSNISSFPLKKSPKGQYTKITRPSDLS